MRIKTWFYFLLFSAIVLFTVWVLQVFSLETMYLDHKKHTFKSIARQIELMSESETEQLNEYINDSALANSMNILIIDGGGNVIMPTEIAAQHNNRLTGERLSALSAQIGGKTEALYRQRIENSSVLIYASRIELGQTQAIIYISAPLESVAQTANLLKFQLLYITILVVLVSFILAFIFSSDLSRPVLQMSRSARRLAKRDFSVSFEGSPYREINELAEALNYAKNELMQADEAQRSLIANVSHDLKTPLTMIKAYAEMIRDIPSDKKKRDSSANIIINEADRLTVLVNDILNLTKTGDKLDCLVKGVENLSELVNAAAEKFRAATGLEGYDIECDITPNLYSNINKEAIVQVIYNLVANAVSYTGEDKRVDISLKQFGDLARFEVKDTGAGIPPEKQKVIWDRYHRELDTHKRPIAGTGLGLSIVKSILGAHGFNFGVISKEGAGSCFYIDFPLSES